MGSSASQLVALTDTGAPDVTGLRHDLLLGPDDEPIMRRYYLTVTKTFAARIHHWIGRDDQHNLHDHPWPNTTAVIAGALLEHTPDGTRQLNPGTVIARDAHTPHAIEPVTEDAWTLFTVGAFQRHWGFHTPTGWVNSKNYPGTGRVADEADMSGPGRQSGAYQRQRLEYQQGAHCWMCGTYGRMTVDHDPPLSSFPHPTQWQGVYRPACKPCQDRQGAQIRNGNKPDWTF